MKKSSLVLAVLLLASPVFADDVKSEQLLTLASADTGNTVVSVQAVKEDSFASDTDKEVKFFGRLLSAKIAADLPEQIAKEAAVNVKF